MIFFVDTFLKMTNLSSLLPLDPPPLSPAFHASLPPPIRFSSTLITLSLTSPGEAIKNVIMLLKHIINIDWSTICNPSYANHKDKRWVSRHRPDNRHSGKNRTTYYFSDKILDKKSLKFKERRYQQKRCFFNIHSSFS